MIISTADVEAIHSGVKKICEKKLLLDKHFVIFGCTKHARLLRDEVNNYGILLYAIIDNNINKISKTCLGVEVYTPETLIKKVADVFVIICSEYSHEMSNQLITLGLNENTDFSVIDTPSTEKTYSDTLLKTISSLLYVNSGRQLKNRILRKHGKAQKLFLCPYPGTGDIYMACSFLNLYNSLHGINSFAVAVVGKSAARTVTLFNINDVEVVKKSKMDALLAYYQYSWDDFIYPLLYWGWRTKKYLFADNHKDITFTEMFKYDVFGLDSTAMIEAPKRRGTEGYAKELFDRLGLRQGRTIILAPYAGSFESEIPTEVWVSMAKRLKESGFDVCTNRGNERELAIDKTVGIFFPLIEAIGVMDYAGGFIGIRSGFCDVISSSNCRMVVIYENGFNASNIEYFSLEKMGLRKEVFETVFEPKGTASFLKNIVDYFISDGMV
jgi:hypothetical protein